MYWVSDWIYDMTDDWMLTVWQAPDSYCVWQFRTSPSLCRSIITMFMLHVDGRREGEKKKRHTSLRLLLARRPEGSQQCRIYFWEKGVGKLVQCRKGAQQMEFCHSLYHVKCGGGLKKVKEYHQGQRDGSRLVSIATLPLILFRFQHCASWWVLRTSVRRPPKSK